MWIALVLALALGAAPTMKDLAFLTRDGCVNTPDMVNNLDDALAALKLPKDDLRTGYPAPTIRWKGKDIFGMSVPKPPYHVPSWACLQGRSSVHRRDPETLTAAMR
jgi:hypothetical protein